VESVGLILLNFIRLLILTSFALSVLLSPSPFFCFCKFSSGFFFPLYLSLKPSPTGHPKFDKLFLAFFVPGNKQLMKQLTHIRSQDGHFIRGPHTPQEDCSGGI
jgi:hypothetical protein